MYDGYTQVQKKAATWTWVSALDCRVPFAGQGTHVNSGQCSQGQWSGG